MRQYILSYLLIALIYSGLFLTQAFAADVPSPNQNECSKKAPPLPKWEILKNKKYEKLYLESECHKTGMQTYVSFVEGCRGRHGCSVATFLTEKVSFDLASQLDSSIAALAKDATALDNHSTAYYIPSRCAAYCNGARLIWADRNNLNVLTFSGSLKKDKVLGELVNTANSLNKK